MKKLLVTLIALGFSSVAMAGLGTDGGNAPHNFYDGVCGSDANDYTAVNAACDESWNTGASGTQEICKVCHTPHMRDSGMWAAAQLWNHELANDTSWTMYADTFGTLDADVATLPTGKSKLCLGCHDGVTALDAYGTHTGTAGFDIDGTALDYRAGVTTGKNLGSSHPVSIIYASSTDVRADADLRSINATTFDGAAVSTALELISGNYYIQCTSCHEPHQDRTENKYLTRLPNTGSELCLACHDK